MRSIDDTAMQEMRAIGLKVREELNQGRPDAAQQELELGWKLIPEPKTEYENSLSFVRGAIRLMAFSGNPSLALRWVDELTQLPISPIDSEPDFLIGVTFFELNNMETAFQHFDRANNMSNGRCFQGEDGKYQKFYKKRKLGG